MVSRLQVGLAVLGIHEGDVPIGALGRLGEVCEGISVPKLLLAPFESCSKTVCSTLAAN